MNMTPLLSNHFKECVQGTRENCNIYVLAP